MRYYIHGELVDGWLSSKPRVEHGPFPTLAMAREACASLSLNTISYRWRVVDAEGNPV